LVIPDKRYCFDHFLPESTIAEVIDAQGRKRHSVRSLIQHAVLTTHNVPSRHWRGDHGEPLHPTKAAPLVAQVLDRVKLAGGAYLDCHGWQFTPDSVSRLIAILRAMRLTGFELREVHATPPDLFEFCASLYRPL
jgi:hypothetical protein